jgi:hypothetical protein
VASKKIVERKKKSTEGVVTLVTSGFSYDGGAVQA